MENPIRACYSLHRGKITACCSPTSAMEEDKDWLLCEVLVRCRCPDVQGEAIFALWRTKPASKGINDILSLRCKAREVNGSGSCLWTVADNTRSIYKGERCWKKINVLALSINISLRSSCRMPGVDVPSLQQQTIRCHQAVAAARSEEVR